MRNIKINLPHHRVKLIRYFTWISVKCTRVCRSLLSLTSQIHSVKANFDGMYDI